jgi:ATP-dependent RNA helicase DDX3X
MNGLSLDESQHANGFGGPGGRPAYIPPHLRGKMGSSPAGPPGPPPGMDGAPPAMNGGPGNIQGSAWAAPQR